MRYHALDAWRGLAALVIAGARLDIDAALWHLPFVRFSYPLVDFFFVLSGFVITHAYLNRLDGARAAGGFVVRRFGRLWPLHAFTLLLLVGIEAGKFAMVAAGVDSRSVPFTAEQSPSTILSSLLLLQAMGLHDHAAWNTPAWSISVEFWTYLAFLAVVMFARSRLVVISVAVIAVSLTLLATRAPHGMESTFDYGLFRCLAGFFLGHLVWRLHRAFLAASARAPNPSAVMPGRGPGIHELGSAQGQVVDGRAKPGHGGGEVRGLWTFLEVASIAALGAWLTFAHGTPLAYAGPFAMAVVVFVFAAERGAVSQALTGRVGQALGAWSYSIYLVCPLIAYVMERGATLAGRVLGRSLWLETGDLRLITLGSELANTALLLIYLAVVLVASALTYRFVESPARRWFNARAERIEQGGARQARAVPAE